MSPPLIGPTPRRRTGRDNVAGIERHDRGRHADHLGNIDDQVVRARLLPHFTVDRKLQVDRVVIGHFIGGHDIGAHRAEAVVGLAHHALLLAAHDDVDQAGIAEHVRECIVAADLAAALADDDGKLAFVMDLAVRDLRQHDRISRAAQARIRLQEEALSVRLEGRDETRAALHLLDVRMIVGREGDHLVRPCHRRLQSDLLEFRAWCRLHEVVELAAQRREAIDHVQHADRRPRIRRCVDEVRYVDDVVPDYTPMRPPLKLASFMLFSWIECLKWPRKNSDQSFAADLCIVFADRGRTGPRGEPAIVEGRRVARGADRSDR